MSFPRSIQSLIQHLSALPGIGPKTAERLVFYLLKQDKDVLTSLGYALLQARDKIQPCQNCGQISDDSLCSICSDKTRQSEIICVVAETADILTLEKTKEFNGFYHVLGGNLDPTEGLTADKLNIKKLEERIKSKNIKEVVLALNPTIEGETTSLYLAKLLRKYGVKITKLARGLPQGSDLEYADEITLSNAFRGRTLI